jgi:hypothetical protein
MKLSENIKYKQNAIERKSVVDLIKYVSIDIYNRIGFVRNLSRRQEFIRVYEVTLTQNLVYELIKFSKENNLNLVGIYESQNEKMNGSDILLCVKLSRGYIKIPVQAKILNSYVSLKNGNYKEFWHKNKIGLQFELLDKYAEKTGSLMALYLLYNYTEKSKFIDKGEKECYYGCSYISTERISKKYPKVQNVVFGHIHPKLARPFYKLFTGTNGNGGITTTPTSPSGKYNDIIDFYTKNGVDINESDIINKIRFYTSEEIFSDDSNWENMAETKLSNNRSKTDKININEFSPKYKIVLIGKPEVPDSHKYSTNFVVTSPAKKNNPAYELL